MYLQHLLERDLRNDNPMVYRIRALGLFFPKEPKSEAYYTMVAYAVQHGLPFQEEPYDVRAANHWASMNGCIMIMFPDKVAFIKRDWKKGAA